jgi:hypothetical protein
MDIELKNKNGIFKVPCRPVLEWLQAATFVRLKALCDWPHQTDLEIVCEPQQIVGSMMHSPGTQNITIHSLRDIAAFQGMWAFGQFHQNTVRIQIPRWQCSVKVNETRGMGHESYDLTVTAWDKTIQKGGTYSDMASTVRINVPFFWGHGYPPELF